MMGQGTICHHHRKAIFRSRVLHPVGLPFHKIHSTKKNEKTKLQFCTTVGAKIVRFFAKNWK